LVESLAATRPAQIGQHDFMAAPPSVPLARELCVRRALPESRKRQRHAPVAGGRHFIGCVPQRSSESVAIHRNVLRMWRLLAIVDDQRDRIDAGR
jgi:hypothetical protein